MENLNTSGSVPTSTPVATPIPTPTPPPTPTPEVVTPTPTPMVAESGGSVSEGGVKGFLKSLNWIEVGLTILGVTALLYTIHYYKFKSKEDKMVNNELQRQIDELKMNVQSSLKGKYKSI